MLAAATSFFVRTAISQSYNIGTSSNGSRASTPAPSVSSASSTATVAFVPTFNVGLWRVQPGSHRVTNKRVSVWSFDKRGAEMERLGALSKERTLEVLKAEASALGRLRHPSILEMVEPLEETRNELIFATEPVLSSLALAIPGSPRNTHLVELDEIEIQKGILQICKGLSFLHSSAKLIHSNISPETVIINNAGDWKISGLGLTIPLVGPDGNPSRWEFPTFDGRMPSYVQRSFDFMAPEYALDEILVTASDMYSLGCLIYAVHCKGQPPFKTHDCLGGLREIAGRALSNMERMENDLQALLRSLITRHSNNRPTPTTLPSYPFFSSIAISTLNFLDRSNFAGKSREEKISFMKGLTTVLDKFSEGLRTRKILHSLVEEMKDIHLLPYILPNVFAISSDLTQTQFASLVLPSLKPLFVIKEPPQNMLTLLDNLHLLQSKTDKVLFREQVLPLVYNALESEHAVVQERALKIVPGLCESIDYAEVQGVLFPRVAQVFTTTRILSVKVATLVTFFTMVQTLDQTSLTQRLVPLLSKIRTKEPAVMMATLSVQEAMGFKVDREAVATLVLPQLWAMSMGPLLNVEQFSRFMTVIRKLGDRVEKEHNQFLRDSQRLEDRSATAVNGGSGNANFGGSVDFESLVGGTVKADTVIDNSRGWDDDVWGSIFTASPSNVQTPSIAGGQPVLQAQSLPSSQKRAPTDFHSSRPLRQAANPPASTSFTNAGHISSSSLSKPTYTSSSSFIQPQQVQVNSPGAFSQSFSCLPPAPAGPSKPNYNLSLEPSHISPSLAQSSPMAPTPASLGTPATHSNFSGSALSSPPMIGTPAGMASLLAPSRPAQWGNHAPRKITRDDWGDFDPLA